jgi:hypothetical protein
MMYKNGKAITEDYGKAREWFERAAAQGNINAQNALGDIYKNGLGVTKDTEQARIWYKKAAR